MQRQDCGLLSISHGTVARRLSVAATCHAKQVRSVVNFGSRSGTVLMCGCHLSCKAAVRSTVNIAWHSGRVLDFKRQKCGLLSISRGTVALSHTLVVWLPPLMQSSSAIYCQYRVAQWHGGTVLLCCCHPSRRGRTAVCYQYGAAQWHGGTVARRLSVAATCHAKQVRSVAKSVRTVAWWHSLDVWLQPVMQRHDCGLLSILRGTVAV